MHLLLANPTAGGGRAAAIASQTRDYLQSARVEFTDISGTSYDSAAANLALALKSSAAVESVIVVGGDGMAHLAIQSLAKTSVPMALIPAGTGNDLARSLSLPLDNPISILDRSFASEPVEIDLGFVAGRYFAEILSTGFDSAVNERANRMRLIKGPMKYNFAILAELSTFTAIDYEFNLDGQLLQSRAMLIAIANGISYGGGMKVCPGAELDDGYFDVMILEPVSKFEFLRVFPKVFSGRHISHPKVSIRRAKRVEVSARAVAYADGERIGQLPIVAQIAPRALRTWRF